MGRPYSNDVRERVVKAGIAGSGLWVGTPSGSTTELPG